MFLRRWFWVYLLASIFLVAICCLNSHAANPDAYIGNAAEANSTDLLDFPDSWTAVDGEYLLISGSSVTTQALGTAAQSAVADFISSTIDTKAEFDAWLTDGSFLYVGDVTGGASDEAIQDIVGAMLLDGTLTYNDTANSITVAVPYTSAEQSKLGLITIVGAVDLNALVTAVGFNTAKVSGFPDPMTTRGDLIYKTSAGTTARLGAGTTGQVLTSDGTDIAWGAPSTGTLDVSGTPVQYDYARFTDSDTLEGRSYSETRSDLNVADGATANSSDATLLDRTNHTGTQAASTISDFDTEVENNLVVTANTAKVGVTTEEQNVQSDWNETAGDALILNKPTTITSGQASAIVTNTAKTGITSGQASAIVTNTAKVGVTTQEQNVQSNWDATTGDALILNKPTTITSGQTSAIVTNTAKTGITSGQASAIVTNTAKVTNVPTTLEAGTVSATTYGITSDGSANDIILPEANTDSAGLLGAGKWDEIVANSLKATDTNLTEEEVEDFVGSMAGTGLTYTDGGIGEGLLSVDNDHVAATGTTAGDIDIVVTGQAISATIDANSIDVGDLVAAIGTSLADADTATQPGDALSSLDTTVTGTELNTIKSEHDNLYTTIGLSALSAAEVNQLELIGATTIDAAQWGYVGGMDQEVDEGAEVTFDSLNVNSISMNPTAYGWKRIDFDNIANPTTENSNTMVLNILNSVDPYDDGNDDNNSSDPRFASNVYSVFGYNVVGGDHYGKGASFIGLKFSNTSLLVPWGGLGHGGNEHVDYFGAVVTGGIGTGSHLSGQDFYGLQTSSVSSMVKVYGDSFSFRAGNSFISAPDGGKHYGDDYGVFIDSPALAGVTYGATVTYGKNIQLTLAGITSGDGMWLGSDITTETVTGWLAASGEIYVSDWTAGGVTWDQYKVRQDDILLIEYVWVDGSSDAVNWAAMSEGTFSYDAAEDKLYVWATGGDDPDMTYGKIVTYCHDRGQRLYSDGTGLVSADTFTFEDDVTFDTDMNVDGVLTAAGDSIVIATAQTPAAADACTAGEIAWGSGFMYVCTASGAWKSVAIETY